MLMQLQNANVITFLMLTLCCAKIIMLSCIMVMSLHSIMLTQLHYT